MGNPWTKPGRAEAGRFTVVNSDSAMVNAAATPTGTVFRNGVSDATSVTITSDAVGDYKWAFTLSDLVAPGDRVELRIKATVGSGSIATGDVIPVGQVVRANAFDSCVSDLDYLTTDTVQWGGAAVPGLPANLSDLSIVAITGEVRPKAADGVAFSDLGGYLMAALFGKATVSDLGDGTANVKFSNRAGTSDLLIVTVSDMDGHRSGSVAY